jgi:hypothetical protein
VNPKDVVALFLFRQRLVDAIVLVRLARALGIGLLAKTIGIFIVIAFTVFIQSPPQAGITVLRIAFFRILAFTKVGTDEFYHFFISQRSYIF